MTRPSVQTVVSLEPARRRKRKKPNTKPTGNLCCRWQSGKSEFSVAHYGLPVFSFLRRMPVSPYNREATLDDHRSPHNLFLTRLQSQIAISFLSKSLYWRHSTGRLQDCNCNLGGCNQHQYDWPFTSSPLLFLIFLASSSVRFAIPLSFAFSFTSLCSLGPETSNSSRKSSASCVFGP